jgi:MYXO-CTERM domain-containing protein
MKTEKIVLSAIGALMISSGAALAQPAIWESDFGTDLSDVTGEDDSSEMVTLSFDFSYGGNVYNDIYMGSNGSVGLGGEGQADDYPSGDEFIDTSAAMIAPFWSDMSLDSEGTAYFNDFGDRAVFTWDSIGTFEDEDSSNTFQLQVFADGKIIFGYNGIEDVNDSYFDVDIHIGLTEGNLDDFPDEVDYSAGAFSTGASVLEIFGYDDDDFDLDGTNIIFTPDGNGGYNVTVPTPSAMTLLALGGLTATRRRRS